MPAVHAPHTETWPDTAKEVLAAIKRRGIPFSQFVREMGEGARYPVYSQNIKQSRPPIDNPAGRRRIAKVEKWLKEHGKPDAAPKGLRDLKSKEIAKKAPPKKSVVADKQEIMRLGRSKVAEIPYRGVTLSGPHKVVTKLSPDMTEAEVFAVFDGLLYKKEEVWQVRIGTLIRACKDLPCFGGLDKFEAAMAKSGRGISSVRKYLTLVERTPMELLELPGIKYTIAAATVTVKDPEKKAALFHEISAACEKGESLTVDEVKKKVAEIVPQKPSKKSRPASELTEEQKDFLVRFAGKITDAHAFYQARQDRAFLDVAPKEETEELRRMLGEFAKLSAKLEK